MWILSPDQKRLQSASKNRTIVIIYILTALLTLLYALVSPLSENSILAVSFSTIALVTLINVYRTKTIDTVNSYKPLIKLLVTLALIIAPQGDLSIIAMIIGVYFVSSSLIYLHFAKQSHKKEEYIFWNVRVLNNLLLATFTLIQIETISFTLLVFFIILTYLADIYSIYKNSTHSFIRP